MTWVATPPSDNGADITSYEWRWRTQGAGAWTSVTTTLPVLTRDGLTNGTAYEAQVRAENSVGQQATRSPSGVGTPVAMVPDQVQFVGLENLSNGVQADWGAPEDNGSQSPATRLTAPTTQPLPGGRGRPLRPRRACLPASMMATTCLCGCGRRTAKATAHGRLPMPPLPVTTALTCRARLRRQ